MRIESLFRFLSKNYSKGLMSLTYSRIEEIIGVELDASAKTNEHYWNNPKIKSLMKKYNIKFSYVNTLSRLIYFEIL